MVIAGAIRSEPQMPLAMRHPHFCVVLGLAWLVTAGWLWSQFAPGVGEQFSDPDDAMRLVEVRNFIAGQGWFDLREPRLDPPAGYLTHWSRLIDGGLAGVFGVARLFVAPAEAERVMLIVWPLLWLLPAMTSVALIAWRIGGREAAIVALLFAVFGLPAFQHFKPGRIDHHNVQVVLSLAVIAAAMWADRFRAAAIAAGALSALALAIGLESLPWVALAGAALVARFVLDREQAPMLAAYGLSLAAGSLMAFGLTVAPGRWMQTACDALAINAALPAAMLGLSLAAIARWRWDMSAYGRATAVAASVMVASAAAIALDPRCIAGPFASMDPAVRPIWLSQVREMDPLIAILREQPVMGVWISAFPAVALAAAVALIATPLRRDPAFWLAAFAFAVAAAFTVTMVKTYSYAMWFGMPLAAVGALYAMARLSRPVRLMAAMVLTPVAISASAITLAQATAPAAMSPPPRQACFQAESYAPLARLRAGTIVTDVDFGPLVLAFTPHRVVAAPYHRLSHGMLLAHRALGAPPDEARTILRDAGIDLVVLCGTAKPSGLSPQPGSLWSTLSRGEVPGWLAAELPAGGTFAAYRVR
jgi:hypothetical protein